jgi:CRISPR-associated protein (TIGR03984 family)
MVDKNLTLMDAVNGFESNSYAILYSPKKCYLALFDGQNFNNESGEIDKKEIEKVFEARVFNGEKELRWVLGCKEKVIISDSTYSNNPKLDQNYLFWGQSTGKPNGEWTEFAEARIGAFFVPLKTVKDKGHAQFTAVEYLKEFADGNMAVVDERLTGIKPYINENQGGK